MEQNDNSVRNRPTPRYPRARTLQHPGRFNPVRIQSRSGSGGRHIRLALQPGRDLFSALIEPLAELDITNASTTILAGFFETMVYCVAPPDPAGKAVIAYSAPRDAGPSTLVFGNATIGKAMNGEPLVHCHAAIRTATGELRGGHILTDRCMIAHQPISVLVTELAGIDLRQTFDPETNIPLIQPFEEARHG